MSCCFRAPVLRGCLLSENYKYSLKVLKMNRQNILSWVITCVMLFGFISGYGQEAGNGVCNQVEQLHRDKFTWMIGKQVDSLDKYLHEDVLYIHSNGWIENKKEILENIRSGKLTYREVDIKESTCRVDGQTAVITGKALFHVSLDGKDIEIPLLYTEVYTLSGERIRFFSRHACRWVTE